MTGIRPIGRRAVGADAKNASLGQALNGPGSMPDEEEPDTPPVVRIVNPTNASTVSGTVVVHVIASDQEDEAGSLKVEVSMDGGISWNRADSVVATLYTFNWATPADMRGFNLMLVARATDRAANATRSRLVPVTVNNISGRSVASVAN